MKKGKESLPTSGLILGGGGILSKDPRRKEKKVILGISTICLLAIVIAVSYAYIAYYARQREVNVLGTDCIKIEYKEKTNAITLKNARPMRDNEGYNTTPYIFEITNVCNVGINYNVNLEILTIKEGQPIENLLESKNIATKIDNLEMKRLTNEIATTPTYDEIDYKATESYTMYKGMLNPGETKSHEVRIWLHESAGNETQNKNFYSKVVIEGIQNELASIKLNEYIMNKNDASIEEISHEATEQTPALTDYRYTGKDPNNYVYFGCEGKECTEENLYRIIGVIPTQSSETSSYKNRVKLIKATNWEGETAESGSQYTASGKGYRWNTIANNKWEESSLQQTLNGEYWDSLGEYQKYIEQAKWYLGAPNINNETSYSSKNFYEIERSNTPGKSKGVINYINNIGIMYPSDYGYSMGKQNEKQSIYANSNQYIEGSWLYNLEGKYYEWTISPEATALDSSSLGISVARIWMIDGKGKINTNQVWVSAAIFGVRPTFYLSEDVLYVGGSGTIGDPYRIGKEEKKFSDYIIAERQNDSSIEQVVHEETEQTGLNATIDYRYTGKKPNNYVCFGSEITPCPSENLYRIIGVIPTQSTEDGHYENRVKLIKNDYYTEEESGILLESKTGEEGYNWSSIGSNKWEESSLQSEVLNGVYWNSLGEYQKYISPSLWFLGAPSIASKADEKYTPQQFYGIERSNKQGYSKGAISFIGNIGLMYPSDFGYSIGVDYQNNSIYENRENYVSSAWLPGKYYEWTISPEEEYYDTGFFSSSAWFTVEDGRLYPNLIHHENYILGIRPTFYLKADVLYSKGDGSLENPYRIGL